ncbi:MAG TPA: potassium transporter Kup [Alphaproteobacteria bacterium]|nr:potassium transporter Kup [Alphaproteobacteria bacterium]
MTAERTTTTVPEAERAPAPHGAAKPSRFWGLVLGSIGVVYGDIGTSPIYALRESLAHVAGDGITRNEVLGVVSLVLWSLILIVTVKYVLFLLRADNKGEGGTLSLLALVEEYIGKRTALLLVLGIMGAALFYGDSMITPAISVLSAVEGLDLATPAFKPFILPITLIILIVLFIVQARGTSSVASLFGPVTALWFIAIAALGLKHIGDDPDILWALMPNHGIMFLIRHGFIAFIVLGSVFLAVTGAEALYADLGHFGRGPIRAAWLWFVFPSLALNYIGQGAFILSHNSAVTDPFFLMCPPKLLLPLIILATLATIIASQAVITGTYSLTQQAIQLGLLPRLEIRHTSATQYGQIFMPRVNTFQLVGVVLIVLMFKTSSNLAAAYGIAVTGTMLVTSTLSVFLIWKVWKKPLALAITALLPLILLEVVFCVSNLLKIETGGYVPLLIGAGFMIVMWTWVKGTRILFLKSRGDSVPLADITGILERRPPARVSGTAVFLTTDPETTPPALLHNLKHNKVLHERNVIVSVAGTNVPRVPPQDRIEIETLSQDFIRIRIKYGYMEQPDIPAALKQCKPLGVPFDLMTTSFFLARRNLRASPTGSMPMWQDKLFIALNKEAASAPDFFQIPPGRVVELGQQIVV